MNRAGTLFLSLLAAIPASAWAQGGIQYDKIEIKTDHVAPNLYMLSGSEGLDPGHPDGPDPRLPNPTACTGSSQRGRSLFRSCRTGSLPAPRRSRVWQRAAKGITFRLGSLIRAPFLR